MAKRITIGEELTRGEEIQLITDFIAALPENSYLAAILRGMDRYATTEIENDWGINIIESRDHYMEEAGKLKSEIERHDQKEAAMQAENEKVYGILECANTHGREMEKEVERLQAEIEEQGKTAKLAYEMRQESDARYEQEIIELKAKLYDMIVKGAAN
jgi:hypothetical protein